LGRTEASRRLLSLSSIATRFSLAPPARLTRARQRVAAPAAAHRNRAHHPELSPDGVDHELGLCVVDVMPAPLGDHVQRVGEQAPQLVLGGL